jgi:hypothetical protein
MYPAVFEAYPQLRSMKSEEVLAFALDELARIRRR